MRRENHESGCVLGIAKSRSGKTEELSGCITLYPGIPINNFGAARKNFMIT